ncbi:hypothetical protein HBB16_15345 [Pseudonocardia sp. MCCB 268]|nr:hypothetical protein [Pseudonocardia cytotoxica]
MHEGMDVRSQNTWLSLRFDVKAVNSLVGRFLPTGSKYKTFTASELPAAVRERPAPVRARGNGGLARAVRGPFRQAKLRPRRRRRRWRRAGPDGGRGGCRPCGLVMLVEEEHQLGGHLRWGITEDWRRCASCVRRSRRSPPASRCSRILVALARYDDN